MGLRGLSARRLSATIVLAFVVLAPAGAGASTLPPGFEETTALGGLTAPTVVRFAPDGTIYVAEKRGLVQTFDGPGDPTPTVYADLRTEVHNFWDRGLLGMELVPDGVGPPLVYVLYTHDAPIGGTAPLWGSPGVDVDPCPTPPGPITDGCIASGRLSRLVPLPGGGVSEDVLIEDWCVQSPSHTVGSIEVDDSGAVYVSGGDGASAWFADWGQSGDPLNPCGDPPQPVGGAQTPPSAEGGALRSQDLRTTGDPATLDGALLRLDPDGSPSPLNPLLGSPDPNAQRIIATGLRNPFRFDVDADGEIWVGDVGWRVWEEIDRVPASGFHNFGWPCYEGTGRETDYDAADLALCEDLYANANETEPPFFAYSHAAKVVAGESCPTGTSALAGMRIYEGASFPSAYAGALFFADYQRDCIWVMRAGPDGDPDPATVATFAAGAANPVHLETGPDGALYYADFDGGRIQRIQFPPSPTPPVQSPGENPAEVPAGEEELEVTKLRLRVPRDPAVLADRGASARVRCNVDCTVKMTLTASGTAAKRMRIDGVIGRGSRRLDAGVAGWVEADLTQRVVARLSEPIPEGTLRIRAGFGGSRPRP